MMKVYKKPLISRKWFFCTSTAIYFVFLHAMIFSLLNTQQLLTKLKHAHKKKFWCLTVSRASFTKTGDILHNLCSFFRNIVMKWNSDTEKITLMKNHYLHSRYWNLKNMTFLKKWFIYIYFTQFFTEKS